MRVVPPWPSSTSRRGTSSAHRSSRGRCVAPCRHGIPDAATAWRNLPRSSAGWTAPLSMTMGRRSSRSCPLPLRPSRRLSIHPPGLEPFAITVAVEPEVVGFDVVGAPAASAPRDVELALAAAELVAAESFDRLLALERAHGLVRLSHQEETARKVLSVLLGRALLADEVGLGKTIEAGIVVGVPAARRRPHGARPGAGLAVRQWRAELREKFGIDTRGTDDAEFRTDPRRLWEGAGVIVASLAPPSRVRPGWTGRCALGRKRKQNTFGRRWRNGSRGASWPSTQRRPRSSIARTPSDASELSSGELRILGLHVPAPAGRGRVQGRWRASASPAPRHWYRPGRYQWTSVRAANRCRLCRHRHKPQWFEEQLEGLSPRQVGDQVLAAIREDRFYVLTHPDWNPLIERRMQNILAGENPTPLPPPGIESLLQKLAALGENQSTS